MTELKPCPFCGGEAARGRRREPWNDSEWFVVCIDCGVNTANFDTKEKATEVWNRRADEEDKEYDAYIAEMAGLEEMVGLEEMMVIGTEE